MPPTPRQRQSAARRPRPSATPAPAVVLPPYQPPQHPLNANAIHALETLPQKHNLNSLKESLKKAHELIDAATADMIQTLTHKQISTQKKKLARANKDPSDKSQIEGEDHMIQLQQKVDDLTKKLEEKTRFVIDVQAKVEGGEAQRRDIAAVVAAGNGRVDIPATQSTLGASQFRRRRGNSAGEDGDGDGEDEDEDEDEDDEETEPREQPGAGIVNTLKRKAEEFDANYNGSSMSERYAKHNDYIGFKKFVHDAQYPDEEKPPLPHASTWFTGDTANLGPTAQTGSEDDIEAVAERVSIKCPLTLLPMKSPVTSQKCPHSFEQDAILEMISHSDLRVGGSGQRGVNDGTKAIKCPVCRIVLTAADLKPDPALKRRIEVMKEKQRREEEDWDDEDNAQHGGRHQPENIDSGDEAAASRRSTMRTVKSERASAAPGTQFNNNEDEDDEDDDVGEAPASAHAPPRSSAMVVDMEDDEDEEGDDDLYD